MRTDRRAYREPGVVPLLAKILTGTDNLSGAACIGRAELFDPAGPNESVEDTEDRHATAARICQTCPALAACREWAAAQPSDDPDMVLAGNTPTTRKIGRPKKRSTAA